MTQRQTTILGFVTLIAVLAAIWLAFGQRGGPAVDEGVGQPLVAGLADRVNDVAHVHLAGPDGETMLTRVNGDWQVAERDGYRADADKVREMLVALVRAERLEPKTANPDRFDRLGLDADQGVTVTLEAGGGERITTVRVGRRRFAGVNPRTFVLPDGEERTWLVSSLPSIGSGPVAWLDREVAEIARARLAGVTLTHPDGEVVRISRAGPADTNFTLEGLGEGEELTTPSAANTPATALLSVRADDVARLDAFEAPDAGREAVADARYRTFDGLTVDVTLFTAGGETWAALTAAFDPTTATEADAPAQMPDAPADGAQEAAELNRRWAGWAYKLPAFKADDMVRNRADLVAAEEATPDP